MSGCLLIYGIFSSVFSVFSVFFASYHFVSHPKNYVSLHSETSETNLFFAISLSSFLLSFCFVSLPSEIRGHPSLYRIACSPFPTDDPSTPLSLSFPTAGQLGGWGGVIALCFSLAWGKGWACTVIPIGWPVIGCNSHWLK